MVEESEKTNKIGQADVGSVLKTTASDSLAEEVKTELDIKDPEDVAKALAVIEEASIESAG